MAALGTTVLARGAEKVYASRAVSGFVRERATEVKTMEKGLAALEMVYSVVEEGEVGEEDDALTIQSNVVSDAELDSLYVWYG